MSSLLLSERPLVVLPSLVKRVGLTRAILLQQIHWLLQQPRCGRMIDGRKWVWGNYAEWRRLYFPFWSERTLQRHILRLEEEGYLLSAQHNVLNWDRTKYYRLNYDRLNAALPCAGCADWDEPAADDADRMEAGGGFEPYEPEAGGAPSDGWAADAGTASPRAASARAGHRGGAAAGASPDAPSNPLPADVRPTAAALAAPERRPAEARTAGRGTADGTAKEGGAERQAAGGAPASKPAAVAASKPTTPAAKPATPPAAKSASGGVRAGAAQGDAPSAAAPARPSPQPQPPLAEQRPPMRRAAPAAPPDSRPPQERGGLAHAAIFGHQFDPAALPPAVRTFWELHGRLPSTAQRQMIEAAQITDQALWRRCLCTWAARGYNPMRIDGPLEWYAAPDLMDARREQRTPPPPAPAPTGPITLDVSPEIAALLAGKV